MEYKVYVYWGEGDCIEDSLRRTYKKRFSINAKSEEEAIKNVREGIEKNCSYYYCNFYQLALIKPPVA